MKKAGAQSLLQKNLTISTNSDQMNLEKFSKFII